MSTAVYRYDGRVQDIVGNAIAGASIAVLTEPANTSSQPGSPLATIYNGNTTNANTITGATWSNLTAQITFVLGSAPTADVVPGAYLNITGVTPTGYNGIWQIVSVAGTSVVVTTPFTLVAIANPGTYVSGGTVATSALPNPFPTDTLGNFFFYALAGVYTVQIFDTLSRISPLVLLDQNVVAGGGSGSVTSVAVTMPGEWSVSGSPITTSGTIAISKTTQSANQLYAGPTSGGAASPTFRALVAADLPAGTGTVTSVAHTLAVPAIFSASVAGSPITTTGTLADTITLVSENANTVWAGPSSGAPAPPTFRSLVSNDLPMTVTTLSSAQILALQTTPVALVPAPGVGFAIMPDDIAIVFIGGGAAYTDAGGAVQLNVGSMTISLPNNNVFLVTTSPNRRIQINDWNASLGTAGNPPAEDNAPLNIQKITNNFAAGTGTAKIYIWYKIIATS